ncbi:MAG: hypothetical protein P4L35_06900 [Ignavibacteriaceae bacterium]|nr:hypothetical protein [Ignavibacteriaceae bacterium]
MSVHLKEHTVKKPSEDIPQEIQKEIEALKIEHDLTQKEINQLIRKTQKGEIKKLELEKQIEYLKTQASKLGDHRRRKRIKDRFNKAYNKFFFVLNTDLYDLDSPINLK